MRSDLTTLSRDELESMALSSVSADDYYELLDALSETSDDDLIRVITEKWG